MGSPLAPKPIAPGLRPHQVDRTSRDRKRKGRSFEDELGGERASPDAKAQPEDRRPPPKHGEPDTAQRDEAPTSPHAPAPKAVPREPGRRLDVEA